MLAFRWLVHDQVHETENHGELKIADIITILYLFTSQRFVYDSMSSVDVREAIFVTWHKWNDLIGFYINKVAKYAEGVLSSTWTSFKYDLMIFFLFFFLSTQVDGFSMMIQELYGIENKSEEKKEDEVRKNSRKFYGIFFKWISLMWIFRIY